jgi:putative hydrolase of the HAD superfamily
MKSIIFIDLDETIMQGPLSPGVFPHIFNEFRKHRPELEDKTLSGELIAILESRYADKRVDAFDWDELVYMLALKHKVPVKVSIEELIKEYAKPPYIKVYDHVITTLQKLREDKERVIAITTNGFWKYQEPTVKALGLRDYFDYILAPDLMSCIKGERRFYQHVVNGSKLVICIGDRYDADVEWPKDLGFYSIWTPVELPLEIDPKISPLERASSLKIPPPFQQKPDAIVTGFDEVYDTVQAIENQVFLSK